MTAAFSAPSTTFVVGEHNVATSGLNGHSMAPILIGLSVPLLAVHVAAPAGLADVHAIAIIGITVLAMISFLMFIASMAFAGSVTSVGLDAASGCATIVYSGLFAATHFHVPFNQIADIKLGTMYDRDGYGTRQARMFLKDGQHFDLPPSTTDEEIKIARELLRRR